MSECVSMKFLSERPIAKMKLKGLAYMFPALSIIVTSFYFLPIGFAIKYFTIAIISSLLVVAWIMFGKGIQIFANAEAINKRLLNRERLNDKKRVIKNLNLNRKIVP